MADAIFRDWRPSESDLKDEKKERTGQELVDIE
jgi:hypothetical protein